MNVRRYYDRYWSESGFYPRGRMTEGLERLLATHVQGQGRVLDVGCGDGLAVGPWFRSRGWKYTGADVAPNAVADAIRAGLEGVVISDAGDLPFDENHFDVVVCLEVLEHLFAPEDALREIQRVLRPNGIVVMTVPNVAYWRRRVDLAILGRWNPLGDALSVDQPWRDPHIRFFNPGSLRRLLRSLGFEVVEVGGHAGARNPALPWIGRQVQAFANGRPYRWLESRWPGLFAYRLHAVVTKTVK